MAKGSNNSYEEARKQRLEDNKKRFEDLGILKMSKRLAEVTKSENKSPRKQAKPRSRITPTSPDTLRRSSRARNPVPSYQEEFHIDRPLRKRSRSRSTFSTSYIARPLKEIIFATDEERAYAIECAENFQSNLSSEHPSFVKSMVRSHVYSCFWLGLPSKFCKDYLPSDDLKMVLENENGAEYDAVYIGSRSGLSGGWRGFALDHKLDDGDAVVFELVEPAKFKVYIFRALDAPDEVDDETKSARGRKSLNSKNVKKSDTDGDTVKEDAVDITRAKQRKTRNSKKAKNSDTDDDMSEQDVKITRAKERKTLSSKKANKSDTDDDTGEQDAVEIPRAKGRKTLNSNKAKKCDTNDDAKTKKPTKATDAFASQRLRKTRSSKKISKDEDKEVDELVEVTENNDVSSQELPPECNSKEVIEVADIEAKEVKKEAVEVAKEDHGSVSTAPQTEEKFFRKCSTSTKLFRQKIRHC